MSDGVAGFWQDEAKCANVDTDKFFDKATEDEVKKFCTLCTVRNYCLEYALVYDMYGIWGGMTDKERRKRYPDGFRRALREDYIDSGLYNPNLKV